LALAIRALLRAERGDFGTKHTAWCGRNPGHRTTHWVNHGLYAACVDCPEAVDEIRWSRRITPLWERARAAP
jgi:hypothetical protein